MEKEIRRENAPGIFSPLICLLNRRVQDGRCHALVLKVVWSSCRWTLDEMKVHGGTLNFGVPFATTLYELNLSIFLILLSILTVVREDTSDIYCLIVAGGW